MSFGWIAAGTALVGAASSYAGSKKQAKASEKASKQQMDQFAVLNAQQQPYIQSGYGALGKLNTLLGIGARPGAAPPAAPPAGGQPPPGMTVNNGPNGPGVRIPPRIPYGPQAQDFGAPPDAGNLPLRHILTMRAQNGDNEARRVLQGMA